MGYSPWGCKESDTKNNLATRGSFPCGSAGKEFACNAGDPGSIPGSGRSPGEGIGYPLQYSGLENSMDCIVHGGTKSRTQLSVFDFNYQLWLIEFGSQTAFQWRRLVVLCLFLDCLCLVSFLLDSCV